MAFAPPTPHWSRQGIPGFLRGKEREFGSYVMDSKDRFPLLRKVLVALGLSPEAVDDIVERILDWLAEKRSEAGGVRAMPYRLRDDFLSPTEFAFCRVLMSAVAGRLVVCPKVNLADLFFVASGDARTNRSLLNRIDRKHVDFLLCDPVTLKPSVGIELDDSSHQRPDRQQRDALVDEVFAAANLPLVRLPARASYAIGDVEMALRLYLRPVESPPSLASVETAGPAGSRRETEPVGTSKAGEPVCPKCGDRMVLRTAKSGARAGGSFWGCRNFPRCRAILPGSDSAPEPPLVSPEGAPQGEEEGTESDFARAWQELNRPVTPAPNDDSRYMPQG